MTLLAACNIFAGYNKRNVLRGVSIQVGYSEVVFVVGPNGCGKSTLLKVLGGALRPQKGQILLRDKDVSNEGGYRRARMGIGYLMQHRNIFPSLTVQQNLGLASWSQGGGDMARRGDVLDTFPLLKPLLGRRAGLLSGGERQALSLSMVLMRHIDVLLLDEPTAGLSPAAADGLLEALQRAQATARFSAIVVEHNLHLVRRWDARYLVMNAGEFVFEGHTGSLDVETLQHHFF